MAMAMALPVVTPVDGVTKEIVPDPLVCKTWPFVPSNVGKVNALTNDVRLLSWAWTFVPIANPRFVLALDVLVSSDKLLDDDKKPDPETYAATQADPV